MRQRSEEHGSGCGCWCSGAVWVDGWAAFARVSGCRLCVINVCAATGEAWMLAARLSASGVATAASMMMPSPVMQECARKLRGACLSQKWTSGPEFKMGTLLSRVATYPPGALRRAGATGDRTIAIAVRDARRRSKGAIYAEDRDASLCSRPLHDGRLSLGVLEFSQVLALVCIFTEPELARPRRAYDEIQSAVDE